jgi:hypothetical protein
MSSAVQRGGPVAAVVVGASLRLAQAHRQQRLTAVEGLDLRLLVDTQHQRVLGRVQVQPDDVAHLLHEQRIVGEAEGCAAVRLEPERLPDAVDGRMRQPQSAAHRARAPVGRIRRLRFQGQRHHAFDQGIADAARRPGARLIVKPVETSLEEAAAPAADREPVRSQAPGDLLVGVPLRARQHDSGAQRDRLRRLAPARVAQQHLALLRGHLDRDPSPSRASSPRPHHFSSMTSRHEGDGPARGLIRRTSATGH